MGEKILIVDDDADTIKFISMILSRLGYQVITAMDGEQALELAHEEAPDLIVLDVMMPGMDGYEVTRFLRQDPVTADTPILMFTAKAQIDDKVTGYNAGANIYLTKPVHPIDLQANIKTLLTQKQARPEAPTEQGYVVGVLASKGGMGVSTVALNLAISYYKKHQVPVIAVEMRPGQGSWVQELQLENPGGLEGMLQKSSSRLTQPVVAASLTPPVHGIRLLMASNEFNDVELANACGQFETILKELRQLAALVVLDIGTPFHPCFSQITDHCDELLLVTEPKPNAAGQTRALVEKLHAIMVGTTKSLRVVTLDRTNSKLRLSTKEVEQMVGQAVSLDFPQANALAYHAAEKYLPLVVYEPQGTLAQQFEELAEQVRQHIHSSRQAQ